MNYYPGSDGRYTIGYYRGKPRHIKIMLEELCTEHRIAMPDDTNDIQNVLSFINSKFDTHQINKAHRDVVHGYETGKYSKRGRPPGSRNRSKSANVANELAALQEAARQLSELNNARSIDPPHIETTNIDPNTFVSKAVFDNHDYKQASDMQTMNESIAVAHGAAKLALDKIAHIEKSKPVVIHIKKPDIPTPINIGAQHCKFPLLLTASSSVLHDGRHQNIYVYGPAGTGKTYAAKKVHEMIFGSKYPFRASGVALLPYEFMGHMHGKEYVRTPFRDAFEFGGTFAADEFDRYAAGATIALNNALANSVCAFADGMVKRHPDFLFIACANTSGHGATMEYNTANKQDAATLNRFGAKIFWPLDEALEESMSTNPDWLALVRKCRANGKHIKGYMVTPRHTEYGQSLIAAGMTIEQAAEVCLREHLDAQQWKQVSGF